MPPAALSVVVGSAALPSPESPAAATLLSASASALATARRLEDAPERFSPVLKVGVILAVVRRSIGLLVWREMAESDPAHAAPASPRREPRAAQRAAQRRGRRPRGALRRRTRGGAFAARALARWRRAEQSDGR